MLLIGYGNPGRGDDGLGPAFVERIARAGLPGVAASVDYQLTVDHALPVSAARRVVFADAEVGLAKPFRLSPLTPAGNGALTSHSLAPGDVLALARLLFGRAPEAWVLGIAGAEFGEISEGLSPAATANLAKAEAFFLEHVAEAWTASPDLSDVQFVGGSKGPPS